MRKYFYFTPKTADGAFDLGKTSKIMISICIIAIAVICAFAPAVKNGFVNLDDPSYVTSNIYIRHLSLENIRSLLTNFFVGTYQPVVNVTYLLEHHFFGLDASFYHATNILLHLLNCLLVFWLLMLLDGNIFVALITALLFGLHPLRVESVVWITERKDVLYSFFFLLALVDYCRYIKYNSGKYYYSSLFLFLLALGSKAMAVTLPLVFFAVDYLLERKITKKTIMEKAPFFISAFLFGLIALFGQVKAHANISFAPLHMAVPFYGTIMYLYKTIFPVNLSLLYPYPPQDTGFYLICLFSAILISIIAAAVIASRIFTRKAVFAFLFALITLSPVIIPFGDVIMADRFTYLPSIGMFYILSVGFIYLYNIKHRHARLIRAVQIIFLSGIIAALFLLTYNRTQVWKDSVTILDDVIKKYPNAAAYNNRGAAYTERGDLSQAISDFTKAIQINPRSAVFYSNRGNVYLRQGELSYSISDYTKVIEMKANAANAYNNRGNAYAQQGNLAQAISDYTKSIEIDPGRAGPYHNRGMIYHEQGDLNNAARDLNKVIELNPGHPMDHYNRGNVYLHQGKLTQAISDYTKALEIAPDTPENYNNRGNIYYNRSVTYYGLGDYGRAWADLHEAEKLKHVINPNFLNDIKKVSGRDS